MASLTSSSRVPAWKKLGLELKFAKESPAEKQSSSEPIPQRNASSPTPNKKRAVPEQNGESATKKQKLENKATASRETLEDGSSKATSNPAESAVLEQEDQNRHKEKKKPRKSVSFTTDTKSPSDHDEQTQEAEAESEAIRRERRRAAKRQKREQRPKRQPRPEGFKEHSSLPSDPILAYITLYHKTRSQWKFQKNRETALLKHILSVERIPWDYNTSLVAYISGLKSDGARKRVAETALEAIEADDADLGKVEGSDEEKDRYKTEVSTFKEGLVRSGGDLGEEKEAEQDVSSSGLPTSWVARLARRKRAELVYFLTRDRVAIESQQNETAKTRTQPVGKTRKMRTAIVEDSSSSSSEDSSDSGSDSDSDSDSKSKHPNDADSSSTSSDADSDSSSD